MVDYSPDCNFGNSLCLADASLQGLLRGQKACLNHGLNKYVEMTIRYVEGL